MIWHVYYYSNKEASKQKLLSSAKSKVLIASIGKVSPEIDIQYKSEDKGRDNAKAYQPFST